MKTASFALHLLNNRDAIFRSFNVRICMGRPPAPSRQFTPRLSAGSFQRTIDLTAVLAHGRYGMGSLRTCMQRSVSANSVFGQILRSSTPLPHELPR